MRKVLYQLNNTDEPKPGIFHCWSGTMQDAYALVEDTTTGKMETVNQSLLRFVQPPELREHKNETIIEALKTISTKIEMLTNVIEGR